MTLALINWIASVIQREMIISHFDAELWVGEVDQITGEIHDILKTKFGDKYLDDADVIVFFKGDLELNAATKDKAFNLLNRAFGASKHTTNIVKDDLKFFSGKYIFLKVTFKSIQANSNAEKDEKEDKEKKADESEEFDESLDTDKAQINEKYSVLKGLVADLDELVAQPNRDSSFLDAGEDAEYNGRSYKQVVADVNNALDTSIKNLKVVVD